MRRTKNALTAKGGRRAHPCDARQHCHASKNTAVTNASDCSSLFLCLPFPVPLSVPSFLLLPPPPFSTFPVPRLFFRFNLGAFPWPWLRLHLLGTGRLDSGKEDMESREKSGYQGKVQHFGLILRLWFVLQLEALELDCIRSYASQNCSMYASAGS